MIEWLRLAGMEVVDRNLGSDWTLCQIAISEVYGHFRGHLDGEVAGVPGAPVTVHVVEFKTHSAKSFAELKKHGVEAAKPMHAAQMQAYMRASGRSRALYIAKNKDTDELYAERLKVDLLASARLMDKAERIIFADKPPPKIRDSAADFPCRFCPASAVCHEGKPARRNCRTCTHSAPTPVGGGEWFCHRHDVQITTETQRVGCEMHRYLPGLVAGEITDVNEADETVTYLMADGSEWTDRGMK